MFKTGECLTLWEWKSAFSVLRLPDCFMSNQQQNAEGLIRTLCPFGFLLCFFVGAYFFFNYAETTYFLAIDSYSPPVPSFCSLLLLHVNLLSSGISRMVGLELRVCEHTVPGVVPMATSFLWLYINSVLSLFDCNFFPVLVLFSGAIQSLFWFVLKLFLMKFECILYSYKNCGHSGESAFSTSHPQSFPISCAFLCCLDKCLLKIYLNS